MRFRSQASLISQTTIINMVSSTIGAVNVANVVSIFLQPSERQGPKRAEREFCSKVAANICRMDRTPVTKKTRFLEMKGAVG
jgi:hypothetical protein